MRARIIPKNQIKTLISEQWVDKKRRPYCTVDSAYIPVKEGYTYDVDLPERNPYNGPGYQQLGNTILIHGSKPTDEQIEMLINWKNPKCILHIKRHTGNMRIPLVSTLYGTPSDVTIRESGIIYRFNPSKIMFSQGNRNEKQRIRDLIQPNEYIADMFAGIGYFSLSAAMAGSHVHAIDINPESCKYLIQNAKLNGVSDHMTIECGDSRSCLKGQYNRIIMGHFDAPSPSFLNSALIHSKKGTVLHIHGLNDRQKDIESIIQNFGYKYTISAHRVKKYSKYVWHNVWDVTLI
ncbi:MAG TPA: 50S ribosomal protein L11 methyltransferase [Methanocorpusculum sp.]|nr:50S ribosomal protein L11 methyltransferase [Methanocorpusculum sp.]